MSVAIQAPTYNKNNAGNKSTNRGVLPFDAGRDPAARVGESDLYGTHFDPSYGVMWMFLKSAPAAKFTPNLVTAIRMQQIEIEREIRTDLSANRAPKINYQVISSKIPGVFSLGGDLSFFRQQIREGNRKALTEYAHNCVNLIYGNATNYGLPITTISLVQGTAFGGGFEAALANDVIVAEKDVKMGLPEIMFNLFPGMGAYHLLCRRLPAVKAEQLILSGRTYSADELHEMGVVDVLAEPGQGENAVAEYIKNSHGRARGRNALKRAIRKVDPLCLDDLIEFVDVWVDTAFELDKDDLKKMDLLARSQQRVGY